jgi:imidazolonepropionase-like amidohydrolase
MKSVLATTIVALLVCATPAQTSIVIRNVTLLDMQSPKAKTRMTVIVEGDRITSVGRYLAVPKNATVVDGRGKFLIPGLWDMHVHVLRPDRAERFFKLFIANGVTGVRDMGTTEGGFAMLTRLRTDLASGKMVGPRIVAAGRIMDGPVPAVPPNSIPFSGEAEARGQVNYLKSLGADFIKVYDGVARDDYFAIIDEAKKINIPVAGHVPLGVTSLEASNARQRSIEHLGNILRSCSSLPAETIEQRANAAVKPSGKPGDYSHIPARIAARTKLELETFDAAKCSSLYSAFVKNQTWQVPTLATKRPLSLLDDGGFTDDPRMKYIPLREHETWRPENNFFLRSRTPEFIVQKKRLYLKELAIVGDMHHAGVPFMTGTDIPGAYTYPGFSLHDELELFVQNGFTPYEALKAATLNPAMFLGLEKSLGTIEVGKRADMVLLSADPLRDIRNTTAIEAVVINGKYLSRADLDAILSAVETAARK